MPAGRPLQAVNLTSNEQKALTNWAESQTFPQLARRAAIILACAGDGTNREAADACGVSALTVGKWRARFLRDRLNGLLDIPRPGAPRKITPAQVAQVLAKSRPSLTAAVPLTTRALAVECGLNQSAVCRIRRSFAFSSSPRESPPVSPSAGGTRQSAPPVGTADLALYKSLGALIKDYRKRHQLSQESLAKRIGVSARALQRWETDRHRAQMDNLHDLAEATGIPMPVCLALNADQPIWYSLRERRFAYSSIEIAHFKIENFLACREQSDRGEIVRYDPITTEKQIGLVLASHGDLYGTAKPLAREAIRKATQLLPDLNFMAFDCWGHYVGHVICLPLAATVYHQLKKQNHWESALRSDLVSDILTPREGVFFFYSAFVTSASVGYAELIRSIWPLTKLKQKERYLAAFNLATQEVKEFFHNFGAQEVAIKPARTASTPAMYEIKLDIMLEQLESSGALDWIIEEHDLRVQAAMLRQT
jgi:transcriptional regulator with XRE-family HTH domain/transposase